MEQYNHPYDPEATVKVKTTEELDREKGNNRLQTLEQMIAKQNQDIIKLYREIARLKDDLDSIVQTIRKR